MAWTLPKFEYRKAKTLEEALFLHASYEGRAIYLAGGTELVPRLKQRLEKPMAVIDIKGIEELYSLYEKDGELHIGALNTLFELKNKEVIKENYPAFYEALDKTSCETLQMRGTIGGNILQELRCLFYNQSEFWRKAKGFCYKMGGEKCNAVKGAERCYANYMSDLAPALLTLNAKVKTYGKEGERTLELKDIYTGKAKKPFDMGKEEILVEVILPMEKTQGGYEKLRLRGSIDYPLLGIAYSKTRKGATLAVGAIGPKPLVYDATDAGRALEEAYNEATPVANTILSPLYRKRMIKVMGEELIKRVEGGS